MAKMSCGHRLNKSLIAHLSGLRLGRRKWRLKKKLNSWDKVNSPGSGPRPRKKKKPEKKNCPGSVKNGMIRKRAAMIRIVCA